MAFRKPGGLRATRVRLGGFNPLPGGCKAQPGHPAPPGRGERGAPTGAPGALLQPRWPRPLSGWARGSWRGKTCSLEGFHPSPSPGQLCPRPPGDGGGRRGTRASPALPWPQRTIGLCLPPLCAGRSQGSKARAPPSPRHLKVGATACHGAAVPGEPLTRPPRSSHQIPSHREPRARPVLSGSRPFTKYPVRDKNRL